MKHGKKALSFKQLIVNSVFVLQLEKLNYCPAFQLTPYCNITPIIQAGMEESAQSISLSIR